MTQVNSKLRPENISIDQFISHFTHEFRTPLNAIHGYCQLALLDNDLSEDTKNVLNEAIIASLHMNDMVDSVLMHYHELSSIEEKVLQFYSIEKIFKEAIIMTTPQRKNKKIELFIDNEDIQVLCDPKRLKRVLINLLSNAVKYNNENGQIWISCHATNKDSALISIKDNGIGIDELNMKRIFLPFFRADNKSNKGDGIGLHICQRFIDMMGGRLWVESIKEEGSTFFISLPGKKLVSLPTVT